MFSNSLAKISLPEGWVWKRSRKYPDKIYYCNVTTGVSTWEFPTSENLKLGNQKYARFDEAKAPNYICNNIKRQSDTLSEQEYTYGSSKKRICEISPPKKVDLTKDEVKSNRNLLSSQDLHSEIPTAIVETVVKKKKKKKKKKAKLLIDETKSSSCRPSLTSSFDKNSNVQHEKCKEKLLIDKESNFKHEKFKPKLLIGGTKSSTRSPNLTRSFDKNCNFKHEKFEGKFLSKETKPSICRPSSCAKNLNFNPKPPENAKVVNEIKRKYQVTELSERKESPSLNSNAVEDIEMLDVSVNLTDIADLPSNKSANYYIVVDTNIFVHEINFIDEIKDTPLGDCGPPHIFIPWVVIQELENLSKRNPSSYKLARKGMKYINQILKAKHPRFHGQSPKEMKDWAQAYSRNNDDRVLECCVKLVEKMPPEKVILLTNDVNLVNKALICDVRGYDVKAFKGFAKEISVSVQVSNKIEEISTQPSINMSECIDKDPQNNEYEETMLKARQMLKDVLISMLNIEMEDAYGSVWKAFKLDLSNLKGILSAVMKYWRMVFSFHFSREIKKDFEFLILVTNRPEGFMGDQEECLDILHAIERIFSCINMKKKKWGTIKPPIENIKKLKSDLQNASGAKDRTILSQESSELTNKLSECKQLNTEVVLSVFEYNWVVLNRLTGMFLDFYQIPHPFSYDKPAVFPPASQFERLMCNLLPAVQMLKVCMSKIVKKNSESPAPNMELYKKFCYYLKTFVPSLEIDIEPPSTDSFTANALKSYCDSVENQEKISFGYNQLETFFLKLSEVAAIISSNNTIKSNEMICSQ